MFSSSHFTLFGFQLVVSLLITALLVVGAILAFTRRPVIGQRPGNLAAAGFGVLALLELEGLLWGWFGQQLIIDRLRSEGTSRIVTVYGIHGLLTHLVFIAGISLLVVAVVARGSRAEPPGPFIAPQPPTG